MSVNVGFKYFGGKIDFFIFMKRFLRNKWNDITPMKKQQWIFKSFLNKRFFSYLAWILYKREFLILDNIFYDSNENYVSDQKMVSSKFLYLLEMDNFRTNIFFLFAV